MTHPIDWLALLKLTNNRLELVKELLDMFAVELPLLHSSIDTAYDKNNWKEMKSQVYKLHESCCYTAAHDLKNLTHQLEEALQVNHTETVETTLKQLNSEIGLALHIIQHKAYLH